MGKIIKITISTVNNTDVTIQVDESLTGFQLKQFIYSEVTQSLPATEMKIHYAGVQIQNDKKISAYKIQANSTIKVLQTKAELDSIPGLILAYEVDPISLEEKTARMPCGHVIGRDCMTSFIRSLVSTHMYKIECPSYKPNGRRCEMEWDYALCRKIGVFTQEQVNQFQLGLSKNYILQNTLQCPQCKNNLYKGDLKTDRVQCPRCKYGDFCAKCLKTWKSKENTLCGNADCTLLDDYLEKSPWDKKFDLKKQSTSLFSKIVGPTYSIVSIFGPRIRACPTCSAMIEHDTGCKHMECKKCKTNFCWICLGVKQKNGWKCNGAFDYCGMIAPTQKIHKQ